VIWWSWWAGVQLVNPHTNPYWQRHGWNGVRCHSGRDGAAGFGAEDMWPLRDDVTRWRLDGRLSPHPPPTSPTWLVSSKACLSPLCPRAAVYGSLRPLTQPQEISRKDLLWYDQFHFDYIHSWTNYSESETIDIKRDKPWGLQKLLLNETSCACPQMHTRLYAWDRPFFQ